MVLLSFHTTHGERHQWGEELGGQAPPEFPVSGVRKPPPLPCPRSVCVSPSLDGWKWGVAGEVVGWPGGKPGPGEAGPVNASEKGVPPLRRQKGLAVSFI